MVSCIPVVVCEQIHFVCADVTCTIRASAGRHQHLKLSERGFVANVIALDEIGTLILLVAKQGDPAKCLDAKERSVYYRCLDMYEQALAKNDQRVDVSLILP